MDYQWDPTKGRLNREKHGVDFSDAVSVFEDVNALTIEDYDHDEERFVTLGMDCFGRILVVVYTWRDETIRLISARKANKTERAQYENEL